MRLAVVGHTAEDHKPGAQLILSNERAAAVRDYLAGRAAGVQLAIEADGRGAFEPAVPGAPPEYPPENRRSVIKVISAE